MNLVHKIGCENKLPLHLKNELGCRLLSIDPFGSFTSLQVDEFGVRGLLELFFDLTRQQRRPRQANRAEKFKLRRNSQGDVCGQISPLVVAQMHSMKNC
jgi:hypothetical protein